MMLQLISPYLTDKLLREGETFQRESQLETSKPMRFLMRCAATPCAASAIS